MDYTLQYVTKSAAISIAIFHIIVSGHTRMMSPMGRSITLTAKIPDLRGLGLHPIWKPVGDCVPALV